MVGCVMLCCAERGHFGSEIERREMEKGASWEYAEMWGCGMGSESGVVRLRLGVCDCLWRREGNLEESVERESKQGKRGSV